MQQSIITRKILDILPTNSREAIKKQDISLTLNIPIGTISREIKRIRLSGIPILWCGLGIYIDYEHEAIKKQNNIINNMREGYDIGMGNIVRVFTGIINGDYEDTFNDGN